MIGLRPYLLTALAVLALVVVGFDASSRLSTCLSANELIGAQEYAQARASYTTVLEQNGDIACAKAGLEKATNGECADAAAIGVYDRSDALKQLLAFAETDPVPGPESCVQRELTNLSSSSVTETKAAP
jgi:hypothetical protein